jgi:hypothetical protein
LILNYFDKISSRVTGLQRDGHHATAGCLDFPPAGNEVRPVGAFDQHIGQNFGDQFARGVLIEQRDGIYRLQRQGHLGPLRLGQQRPPGSFEAPDAGVGIERQHQNVAQRPRLLQQPDVARMQEVVATVGKDHGLALLFPERALAHELRTAVEASHRYQCTMRPMADPVLDWLLEGDPAIRWQALRDLKGAAESTVRREQRRVAKEGWGTRLLELQDPDGRWAQGIYTPKWTSTTYTLVLLRSLGLSGGNGQAVRGCRALLDTGFWEDGGINFYPRKYPRSETCVSSMVLAVCSWFHLEDARVDLLADHVIAQQMADGGWNCRAMPGYGGATHGSFHTTISALEALLDYERLRPERAQVARQAQARGREFLLVHRLFRSHRTGRVAKPEFTRFPFPARWHYDVLRGLEYFRDSGAPRDSRLADGLALVAKHRRPDGRWTLPRGYPGKAFFDMERVVEPSRWNTLRVLRVLKSEILL